MRENKLTDDNRQLDAGSVIAGLETIKSSENSAVIDPAIQYIRSLETLFWLAAHDYVFFGTYNPESEFWEDNKWFHYILCNDTFFYASADAEALAQEELPTLRDVSEKFGWSGVIAYAALRRKMEPLEHLRTEKYYEALAYLKGD